MSHSHTQSGGDGTGGPERHVQIDWMAAENSPEFQDLVKRKRSFVVPATIFFLVWYAGFILLAGYAEDFMGTEIVEGLTLGYLLALTQFIMTWALGAMYLRRADRDFDPLARKAAERALEVQRGTQDRQAAAPVAGGAEVAPR